MVQKLSSLRRWFQPGGRAPEKHPSRIGKLEDLSKTDLFRDPSHQEIQALDWMTVMSTCRLGTVFYEPAQAFEVLFILNRGHVNLYQLSADGRKLITAMIAPGTIFDEMSLIGQSMRQSYAEAVDECLTCVMSPSDLERLIVSKPIMALRLIELLSGRIRHLETRLERMAFRDAPSRLAAVLLELVGPEGQKVLGLSHQDLADMAGTSRKTITRILDEWRLAQMIELRRMRIVLRDRGALRMLAGT